MHVHPCSSLRVEATRDEVRQGLFGRVPPPDAERVPCRVSIDLVPFLGVQVVCSKQCRPEARRLRVRRGWISYMQVHMYLLRSTVRPVRRNVIRRQLHAHSPLIRRVKDAVKRRVVVDYTTSEQARPESALNADVCGIKDNYLPDGVHARERSSAPAICRGAATAASAWGPTCGASIERPHGGRGTCPSTATMTC